MLVTGAGHGIGRELALRLAGLGCLVVCVDRDGGTNRWALPTTRSRATASDIKAGGGLAWAFQCDVSNREEVGEMARWGTVARGYSALRQVWEEVGDVNILVNNAGIMVIKQVGGNIQAPCPGPSSSSTPTPRCGTPSM